MENIRQMKVSVKQRRIRDKLAGASEARGSLHHAEIAKLRVQIEEFEVCWLSKRNEITNHEHTRLKQWCRQH